MKCPKCGMEVNEQSHCSECGASLIKRCAKCGREIINEKFCPSCGTPVHPANRQGSSPVNIPPMVKKPKRGRFILLAILLEMCILSLITPLLGLIQGVANNEYSISNLMALIGTAILFVCLFVLCLKKISKLSVQGNAEPKQGWDSAVFTLLFIGGILAVIVIGSSVNAVFFRDKTPSTSSATVSESTEAALNSEAPEVSSKASAENEYAIGETCTLDNWEITVSNFEFLPTIENGGYTPDEGNQYAVVHLTVFNQGKEAESFLPSFSFWVKFSINLIYSDGYEYSPTRLIGYDPDLHSEDINPLSSKDGEIVFEVPQQVIDSTEPLLLELDGRNKIYYKLR